MDTIKTTRLELTLGEAATGSIDPANRNLRAETVAAVEADVLAGAFDVPVQEGVFLPCGCIDGRCPHADALYASVPNAAGGTLSLLVGELLTTRSNLASTAETTDEALASLIEFMQTEGYGDQVGGHTGPAHGSDSASGCGANDQLRSILRQMVEKPDVMAAALGKLNVPIDAETELAGMIAKADELTAQDTFFASGKAVAETLAEASGTARCPELIGEHNEVLIRLNMKDGTTLDRRALQAAYGDDYQVFNVDVWALKAAAETLSYSADEARAKFAAMVMYQVATALQLCGPSMRVIVAQ